MKQKIALVIVLGLGLVVGSAATISSFGQPAARFASASSSEWSRPPRT